MSERPKAKPIITSEKPNLSFTLAGETYQTGRVNGWHLIQLQEHFPATQGQSPNLTSVLFGLLTMLLDDAGHLPEGLKDWRDKLKWTAEKVDGTEVPEIISQVYSSMPKELTQVLSKIMGQAQTAA